MNEQPALPSRGFDSITVHASASAEIAADQADLVVMVKGSSLFTGSAALQKAREVRQLVTELAQVGIEESAIMVLNVMAETSSSVIGKTSSATYQLSIRCTQLEQLADLLGVMTAQKNADLRAIIWRYPDAAPVQDDLLRRSLVRAQAKAQLMVAVLASTLDGVYSVSETVYDSEQDAAPTAQAWVRTAPAAARARALTGDDLGLAVMHTKRIKVDIKLIYHISSRTAATKC